MFSRSHRRSAVRRALFAIGLAGFLIAGAPAAASAEPPTKIPLTPSTIVLPAGFICPFTLQITEGPAKEVFRIHPDGRASITGQYKVTLTNLDTDASLAVNVSGPWHFNRDGVLRETGRQLFGLSSADFSGPGLFVLTGNISLTRDDAAIITSITYTGTRSGNLCDALS